ncbi:hypothetical protein JCM21900_003626 [Sporobolomyces salmonicolor]
MSVLFETSLGDIIVDLETTLCPILSLNFIKLCKAYRYNFCSFHNVIQDFIAQTGDPTDTGAGGSSIFHLLPRSSPAYQPTPYFVPETSPKLKHKDTGTLSMAIAGEGDQRGCGSQFFFTLKEDLDYLDGKHAPFGRVIEGEDTLSKINEALTDQQGRPLRDIRIRHVVVLDDPFPDPEGLDIPPTSPVPTAAQLASLRVGDEESLEESGDPEEVERQRRERDARAQALTLEMVGDLPFADVAPPENVLFVCKLNQVTTSEDLELIFSRFGEILSCEIIRDQKTGDSLQYAFIEFRERADAERAYLKMDNVLVDDRRIHVDFSQSVSKLHNSWVFNKTGGRPPPNKSGRSHPSHPSGPASSSRSYDDDRSTRYGEDPETAPLISDDSDPFPASAMVNERPSSLTYLSRASFGGAAALGAQLGVGLAVAVLWRVLWMHPAGLFTYHPAFQSLAVLGFIEGVLLLQPIPANAATKKKGLQLHQVFQYTAFPMILVGAAFIIANKALHDARHFTTWHATFGILTLVLIVLQISFGALVVYSPLISVLGGEGKAKSLWKYHRMSGYLTLTLLILTPLLALASDWVVNNSSQTERALIGFGLGMAGVGVLFRIRTSKLGLQRQ